jgi:TPR repeat protein
MRLQKQSERTKLAIPNPQALDQFNQPQRETCHVEFYLKAVKNGVESSKQGKACYDDIEYARLTPPGGNLIVNKKVDEALINRFRPQYEAYKRDEEMPENGTHVRLWPIITPAEVKRCLEAQVRTIEAVAEMNENCIQKVGMGARALKEKAINWLKSASEQGTVTEKMQQLKVEADDYRLQNEQLLARNDELKAKIKAERSENKAVDIGDLQDILAELKTENAKLHLDLKDSKLVESALKDEVRDLKEKLKKARAKNSKKGSKKEG